MNCANCGNELPPGARVCPNCGTPVPNVFPAPPGGPAPEPTVYGGFGPFRESGPTNPPTPAAPDNAAQQGPPAMPQDFYSATGYGGIPSPPQYQPPAQQPFPPNQPPFSYPSQQPPLQQPAFMEFGSPQQAPASDMSNMPPNQQQPFMPDGQQPFAQPGQSQYPQQPFAQPGQPQYPQQQSYPGFPQQPSFPGVPPQQFSDTTQQNAPIGNPPSFPGAPPQQQPYPGQPGQTPMGQDQRAAPQMQWRQTQGPSPRPKSNLPRIIVLAAIALVVIIAAVVGIFVFTTNQHNQQVAATGTASSQTQVAQNNLNATATQSAALATATQGAVNATATAANTFPAVAGNYTGTITNSANAGKQLAMALALQQVQQSLTGICTLATLPLPIQNGAITLSGQVTFAVTIPASSSSSAATLNFVGSVQSNGGLAGTWTSTTGGQGPWSTTKS